MKRTLLSLALVLTMATVAIINVVPASAEEETVTASVTVNEVISVTISDADSDGVQFGSLDQGTPDSPDVAQSTSDSSAPAVTVAINVGTNVNVDVSLKGTDFDTSVPITGASWAEGAYDATKNYMTTSHQLVSGDVAPGASVELWHFLTVPADAAVGTFSSTYTYQVLKYIP